MDSQNKKQNVFTAMPSRAPEIGPWLWALQDGRKRTLETVSGVKPAMIDWLLPDNESSIGTVLYHMADIEADWLYVEVLEQSSLPPDVAALFPCPTRDDQGLLTQVSGFSLAQHLTRLEIVRGLLLDVYQEMELAEFRRVRSFPYYDVTPEWVLHHLLQHEAEHRSQIGWLRARAEQALASA